MSRFSPVSSTNKTDCHDITGILLKVALNTIKEKKERSFRKDKVSISNERFR
jgi:hypothetical protein